MLTLNFFDVKWKVYNKQISRDNQLIFKYKIFIIEIF